MSDPPSTPPRSNSLLSPAVESTPVAPGRSSFETGAGNATHGSVDRHLLYELDGRMIIDIADFAERYVFPEQGSAENERLDCLVEAVDRRLKGVTRWTPQGWLGEAYLPWFIELVGDLCKEARAILGSGSMESVVAGVGGLHLDKVDETGGADEAVGDDKVDGEHGAKDKTWIKHLKSRVWVSKPRAVMTGGDSKRSVDIVLSASPGNTAAWSSALVLGEHKSCDMDTVAALQLAGYVSDAFGAQAFRHVFHGFTIMPGGLRLWRFDRSGGLSSTVFSCVTDDTDPATRQMFIKIILAYTVMDDVKLGFDPDVFSDFACTKPCHYTAAIDPNNCWAPYSLHKRPEFYVRIVRPSGGSASVYRLFQRLFIRPGIACRGTVCFRAFTQDGEQCIVKFLWRYTSMAAEGLLLESVEQTEGVYGVVRVLCYDEKRTTEKGRGGVMSGLCLKLLTTDSEKTTVVSDPLPDRVLTRTALKDVGRPLQTIERPLDLCHILHRDISTSNILVPRHPLPGPSSDIPQILGFIIDLDYAIKVDPAGGDASSGASHRTGTLPFMAIDILAQSNIAHCYHHDVESFLYVLIWRCIYKTKPVRPIRMTYGPVNLTNVSTSTKSAKSSASAPTQSRSYTDVITKDRSHNDEVTKAKAPLRRSARLASKSPVGSSPSFTWELDRSYHSPTAIDPLTRWRRDPEEAAAAKKSQVLSESPWEKLLESLRPGFNSAPMINLLTAIRDVLFKDTLYTAKGKSVVRFSTPSERIRKGEVVRDIDWERELFEDVKALFLLATEELQALESASL